MTVRSIAESIYACYTCRCCSITENCRKKYVIFPLYFHFFWIDYQLMRILKQSKFGICIKTLLQDSPICKNGKGYFKTTHRAYCSLNDKLNSYNNYLTIN